MEPCERHQPDGRDWCMDCNPEKYPRLPDPARPMEGRKHHDGHDTEHISAALVAPRSGTQRAKVLLALQGAKETGVTDNELHFVFMIGAYPHVAATRREELIADGWPIVDSGKKRLTRSGDPAIVWVLRDAAPAPVAQVAPLREGGEHRDPAA